MRKPVYPIVIETFDSPDFRLSLFLDRGAPYVLNGEVAIRRYRVTAEVIDEPREVLVERLRKLWREQPYNMHQTEPMRAAARELGIELDPDERAVDFRRREARS